MNKTLKMINEGFNKKYLNESYVISPNKEYKTRLGNRLLIKEVEPSIDAYSGEVNLRIKYEYKLRGSDKWGTSVCSAKDFFNMLNDKHASKVSYQINDAEVNEFGCADDDFDDYQ